MIAVGNKHEGHYRNFVSENSNHTFIRHHRRRVGMGKIRIKTVQTTLDIIEEVVEMNGVTASELAKRMDMPISTIHDYLNTLKHLDYVVEDNNTYRSSLRFLRLGEKVKRNRILFEAATPVIQEIVDETGEYVFLGIEENSKGAIFNMKKGKQAVDLGLFPGMLIPLHATVVGKIVLAYLSADQRETLLDTIEFTKRTENTITDRDQLVDQLSQIRDQGIAFNDEEYARGVRAIGAPILENNTVHGVVGIVGPTQRMASERFKETLPELLLESTNLIEISLFGPINE